MRSLLAAAWVAGLVIAMFVFGATFQAQTLSKASSNGVRSSNSDVTGNKSSPAADAGEWNGIESPMLSNDGEWTAYSLTKKGDAQLVIRSNSSNKVYTFPQGNVDPIQVSAGRFATKFFTADSRFLVFLAGMPGSNRIITSDDIARRNKGESLMVAGITTGIGIVRLATGEVEKIDGVKSFKLSPKTGRYVTLTSSPGSPFVIKDLETGKQTSLADVTEFDFDPSERYLGYIRRSTSQLPGVAVTQLADGKEIPLLSQPGDYQNFVFDEKGTQAAFVKKENGSISGIYHSKISPDSVEQVVKPTDLNDGTVIGSTPLFPFTLKFIATGAALMFDRIPKAKLLHSDAKFQFYSTDDVPWSGPSLSERVRWPNVYRTVFDLEKKRLKNVEDPRLPYSILSSDGLHAILLSNKLFWANGSTVHNRNPTETSDLYLYDVSSGSSRLIKTGVRPLPTLSSGFVSMSPGGRYAVFYSDLSFWSLDLESGKLVDLTAQVHPKNDFSEYDWKSENSGRPAFSRRVGVEGWMPGDGRVVINAWHDVWEFDPTGVAPPTNITKDYGVQNDTIFRFADAAFPGMGRTYPNWSIKSVTIGDKGNLNQANMLVGINEKNYRYSLWKVDFSSNSAPTKFFEKDGMVQLIANQAGKYLYSIETYKEFPNLWLADGAGPPKQITNIKSDALGSVELVSFKSDFGETLKGMLYKPDNFDSSKKYPLIVKIYQDRSQVIHNYGTGGGYMDFIEPSFSRGYLYFEPDVKAYAPNPSDTIVGSVVPAVRSLIDRGIVDPKRICLFGHSFGGYETNVLVTRTDIFRCAISASGFSDLVSKYGDSPMSGASTIAVSQANMRTSVQERPLNYIYNSPIFFADKVKTPLLMNNNEKDAAVDWNQGMRFLTHLRRNGKEAYLFNYPGEGHVLYGPTTVEDFTQRMWGFIDYYLKDAPRPGWMVPEPTKSETQAESTP